MSRRQKSDNKALLSRWMLGMLLVACMLFVALQDVTSVSAYDEKLGTITADRVNVRSGAGTTYEEVGKLVKGDTVTITGEEKPGTELWYKVKTSTLTGYVRSDLLSVGKTLYVAKETVRVRVAAGTDSDVVATLSQGIALEASAQVAGSDGQTWYKVSFSYNNQTYSGYIRSDMTSTTKPVNEVVTTITGTLEEPQESSDTAPEEVAEPVEEVQEPAEEEAENDDTTQPQEPAEVEEVSDEVSAEEEASTEDDQISQYGDGISVAGDYVILEPPTTPYLAEGFEEKMISSGDGTYIRAWQYGEFFIFYATDGVTDPDWYMYDSTSKSFQRYIFADRDAQSSSDAGIFGITSTSGKVILIVLVTSVILLAVALVYVIIHQRLGVSGEDDDEQTSEPKPRVSEPRTRVSELRKSKELPESEELNSSELQEDLDFELSLKSSVEEMMDSGKEPVKKTWVPANFLTADRETEGMDNRQEQDRVSTSRRDIEDVRDDQKDDDVEFLDL